jgi:hypothetical protein
MALDWGTRNSHRAEDIQASSATTPKCTSRSQSHTKSSLYQVHGDHSISADTALRLARYFGTSERFWLNLQARYDLDVEASVRALASIAIF